MKLTKDKIVAQAIALLHEQGLKQVTLRNLAARLNIQAPSLFWHIKNKDELLSLINASIFRQCVENIPLSKTWQQWLEHYGLSLWEAQCKAPDIPNLITQVDLSKETRETFYQLLYSELSHFSIDMKVAMKMQASVQALVTGWTVLSNPTREINSETANEYSPFKADMTQALKALIHGWEEELK